MMPFFQNSNARKKFENVMVAYVNYNTDFEVLSFKSSTVPNELDSYSSFDQYIPNGSLFLAGPFVYLMKKESTAFFCLHGLIKKMEGANRSSPSRYCSLHLFMRVLLVHSPEEGFSRENEAQNVSTFMMFFQQMLPELFAYFEDEEVGPNDWAVSWIRVSLVCFLSYTFIIRKAYAFWLLLSVLLYYPLYYHLYYCCYYSLLLFIIIIITHYYFLWSPLSCCRP
jgi:hypothetical protein